MGNGSSGVQIVPALQPCTKPLSPSLHINMLTKDLAVKKLVHVFRSPTWIAPPHTQVMAASPAAAYLSTIQFDAEGRFTESQIEEFKAEPQKYAKFVKVVEAIVNSRFPSVRYKSPTMDIHDINSNRLPSSGHQWDSRSHHDSTNNYTVYEPRSESR